MQHPFGELCFTRMSNSFLEDRRSQQFMPKRTVSHLPKDACIYRRFSLLFLSFGIEVAFQR